MRVFRDMELVEQLGSGIPRILQSYGKACFHFSDNYIRMSFPAILEKETVGETVGETAAKILALMKDNPNITRSQLAKALNMSVRGIEYNISKLRKSGVVHREGSTKSGIWVVKNKI